MNKVYLITLSLILLGISVKAQQPATEIIKSMIDKMRSYQTVQFNQISISKNPFSSGDTIVARTTSQLKYDGSGNLKSANAVTTVNGNQSMVREVLLEDSLYTFNLLDSTFTVVDNKKGDFTPAVTLITDLLTKQLAKDPSKIVLKADTIVDNIMCYQIMINSYDTVINGNHNYTHWYLLIDKLTLNPVYLKEIGEGVTEKSGYVIGRLQFFNETRFSDVNVNGEIAPTTFYVNRAGFTSPNTAMLTPGTIAPPLELKDLTNRNVSSSSFKNKIVLIEFGGTACAANPLANPMLNRLHQKYSSADVSIMSIYTDETSEQVNKYVTSNKLLFPIYLGARQQKKAYRTLGIPNFYLLDRKGTVIESIDGYSGDLEEKLEKQLNSLLNTK